MALEEGQWQIRDLVIGADTVYRLLDSSNPFDLAVRADQGGPRAWNHGSWSGAEWANERVVPIRLLIRDGDALTVAAWKDARDRLAAAFAPVGDVAEQVELRYFHGGEERVLFGRPRLLEFDTALMGLGSTFVRAGFVAQDPRIYSGTLHQEQTGLPVQTGGLTIPGVSATTPPFGLVLAGAAGDHASTPNHASLNVTGDLEVSADATRADWTPASDQSFLGKYESTGELRQYRFDLRSTGVLRLRWSTNGTALSTEDSTVAVPVSSGRLAVRATLDVDLGGVYQVVFWTAPTSVGPWTQLGAAKNGVATTSIFAGTAPLEVGSIDGGGVQNFAGTIHSVEVRNGIGGTLVASPEDRKSVV